ncbi:hypothetical protein [Candidatus Thioglobus sp.]|uniref:hypothetical protein n=1 Tax=Candidatus Thioglobus sp. TaxID=2026721 RepID=UPI00262AF0EA|nr:hypothetical protein [Candidatus Thioglobus sp.]MDG2395079.1 hypothetical protein [Candidatus Thioglobus sp.]
MKNYIVISGLIFSIIAFAHLIRIINDWMVVINDQSLTMSISYLGFIVATILAIWAFTAK